MNVRLEGGNFAPPQNINTSYKNVDTTLENGIKNPYAEINSEFIKNEKKNYETAEALEYFKQGQEEFKPLDNKNKKEVSENLNTDERMRQALELFHQEQAKIKNPEKQQQMESDWRWSEISQKEALQKKQERAERKSSPESTSVVAAGARFSTEPKGLALEQKQKDLDQGWSHNEKVATFQTQLTRLQEALNRAHQARDTELVELLEEQEKNLLNTIEENYSPSSLSQEQQISVGKTNIEIQQNKKSFTIPESLITDVEFNEIPAEENNSKKLLEESIEKNENENEIKIPETENQQEVLLASPTEQETQQEIQTNEPSQDILYKLQEMQIKYEDLVQVVPVFASMSEGQQAYILAKSEEQGMEQIQDRADKDFQRKIGELFPQRQTKVGKWVAKLQGGVKAAFLSGKFRREANRNAANQHTGLNAFSKDIEHLTKHVSENGWDINLNQDGTYQIEYISKPEGTTEREAMFFDNYNRYATALSDIPYEWGLPTASGAQKKAYKEAYENFGKCEKALRTASEQDGEEHPDILRWTFKTRGEIELNQFFSNERDISEKLDNMKNASFKSDLVKKIFTADGLTKTGLKTGIVASSFGTRIFSKALYGLGGAMGASAIIGGILGWRQKSTEFKQDEKDLRRQGVTQEVFERLKNQDKEYQNLLKEFNKFGKRESLSSEEKQKLDPIINAMHARERMFKNQEMGIKSTDKSVFDAKANTERINKLLMKVANEKDPLRREKSLNALQDRLQILDERLKAGRVNFGKTKDQLENKTALMEALVQAHVYRQELSERAESGNARKVDTRISGYFEKQDKQSGKERFNEKTKNAIKKGAAASAITGVVAGLWMISEYFGGDDTAKAIKAAIDTNIDPTPVKLPNPTDFEVSVDASPRGAIATYENLQQELIEKYPNPELRPPHVQEFIDTPAEKLAMEDNMYRPGEVNESAKIFKGGKLGFNANGERFYTDARNGMDILSGEGKFDGEHFDFKSYSEAKVTPENVGSEGVGTGSVPKPEGTENIFNATQQAEEMKYGVPREVKLSKNLSTSFSIGEGKRGGLVSAFPTNLEDFNAYHKAYLNTDVKSYIDRLATETNFLEENKISREKAESGLNEIINQMIVRDQVLQEGGLDPNGEAYKILANERNELEKLINKDFGYIEGEETRRDIINSFDGRKYPDPNFGTGAESVGPSQGVESQPENVVTPETTNTPEVKTVRMRNNVIGQDFEFQFTKNPDGSLMYSNETINPNKIPNEYIEKRLGFNPDWRKTSGLPLTFEDQPNYKRLIGNIDRIKIALAGMDSFPPNTEEHQAFKSVLNTMIKMTEKHYPEIFNYQTN